MTGQLPDLLEKSKELPHEAEGVKAACEHEFEVLDVMKKTKAIMGCAINLKLISKIPIFVQAAVNKIKDDFQEL